MNREEQASRDTTTFIEERQRADTRYAKSEEQSVAEALWHQSKMLGLIGNQLVNISDSLRRIVEYIESSHPKEGE